LRGLSEQTTHRFVHSKARHSFASWKTPDKSARPELPQILSYLTIGQHVIRMRLTSFFHTISDALLVANQTIVIHPVFLKFPLVCKSLYWAARVPLTGAHFLNLAFRVACRTRNRLWKSGDHSSDREEDEKMVSWVPGSRKSKVGSALG